MDKIVLLLLAIFLPPLAVFLTRRKFDFHFGLNLCLILFVWIPAVLHAMYIPHFRVKMDIVPNRYTSLWFEATEVGT